LIEENTNNERPLAPPAEQPRSFTVDQSASLSIKGPPICLPISEDTSKPNSTPLPLSIFRAPVPLLRFPKTESASPLQDWVASPRVSYDRQNDNFPGSSSSQDSDSAEPTRFWSVDQSFSNFFKSAPSESKGTESKNTPLPDCALSKCNSENTEHPNLSKNVASSGWDFFQGLISEMSMGSDAPGKDEKVPRNPELLHEVDSPSHVVMPTCMSVFYSSSDLTIDSKSSTPRTNISVGSNGANVQCSSTPSRRYRARGDIMNFESS